MPCSLEDFKMILQAGGHMLSFRSILDSEQGIIVWFFGIMLVYAILSEQQEDMCHGRKDFEKHRGENMCCMSNSFLDSEHETAEAVIWAGPPKSHTLKGEIFRKQRKETT
jgi:hypothetical protein